MQIADGAKMGLDGLSCLVTLHFGVGENAPCDKVLDKMAFDGHVMQIALSQMLTHKEGNIIILLLLLLLLLLLSHVLPKPKWRCCEPMHFGNLAHGSAARIVNGLRPFWDHRVLAKSPRTRVWAVDVIDLF